VGRFHGGNRRGEPPGPQLPPHAFSARADLELRTVLADNRAVLAVLLPLPLRRLPYNLIKVENLYYLERAFTVSEIRADGWRRLRGPRHTTPCTSCCSTDMSPLACALVRTEGSMASRLGVGLNLDLKRTWLKKSSLISDLWRASARSTRIYKGSPLRPRGNRAVGIP
jgi:hypothetical protein